MEKCGRNEGKMNETGVGTLKQRLLENGDQVL